MKLRETAAAFAEACLCSDDNMKRLRNVAQLVDTASTRLQLAMCQREDMSKLLEEARKSLTRKAPDEADARILSLVVDNTKQ